jgi:hypothetical protein
MALIHACAAQALHRRCGQPRPDPRPGMVMTLLPKPFWQYETRTDRRTSMSLPASQQRALDRIEKKLQAGDPRLRSLFAIFTRLTWHEALLRFEQVKSRLWQPLIRPRRLRSR